MERKYTKKFESNTAGKKPFVKRTATSFAGKTTSPSYKGRQSYTESKPAYRPTSTVSTGYKPRQTSLTPSSNVASTGYAKKTYTPRVQGASLAYTKKSTSWSKSKFEKKSFGGKKEYTPRENSTSKPYGKTSFAKPGFEKPVYGGGVKRTYAKRAESPAKKPVFKSVTPNKPRTASASWGAVASWYDKHLNEVDTYHEKVILPNLLRLIDAKKSDNILDLACGQGYFTRALEKSGANVTGVDIAAELIAIAKKESPLIPYHVGSAENLSMCEDAMFTKALISLSIQNIEHIEKVMIEASRVLNKNGELHIVMNHPAFRIPKESSWGYDDKKKVQYRRIDQYLSNSNTAIDMHPGFSDSPQTISFHRPLQYYVKAFTKAGFVITKLEEWISHRASDSGPRANAENNSRKEIPLFLYMKLLKA